MGVLSHRLTALLIACFAALAAALPAGASAFPVGSLAQVPAVSAGAPVATAVREQLHSAGVYELSVTVTTHSSAGRFVDVEVGSLARRAAIDQREHRASLDLRLAITRRDFTVRVSPARTRPHVSVRLRRLGAVAAGTAARSIALAVLPAAQGKTRASGPVTKPAKATTTTRASTGSTGASGSSAPATPPATPPAPAAPVVTYGPSGNPIITTPSGFAPIKSYSNLVKDYQFDGSSLPADWSAGTGNHGFSATDFQPSQVTMTGSSVALSANNQPDGNDPNQGGWISTEGNFSMTYGMIDYRAKMPAGQGLWSALWLDQPDGSSPWGEIDVAEMLLGDTHTVYGSLHNWAPGPDWGELQTLAMGDDASQEWEDYQVVWQPGYISWAVDGVAYAQYSDWQAASNGQSGPFDDGTGFYLIADLAVAGQNDWGGPPTSSTVFPATMQIQSVKVWQ
jgi:hypothetical protein